MTHATGPPSKRAPRLYAHLLQRIQERGISGAQLTSFIEWLDTQPEVPNGRWFKKFPGMIVCGEDDLVKTFLAQSQTPTGEEIQ